MNRRWLGPLLIVLSAAALLLVYNRLPEQVPTHWSLSGEVDDWGPRFPFAFFGPLIAAALWILLPLLRKIDPRRKNYDRFDETFWLLLNAITIGMLYLHGVSMVQALGYAVDMPRSLFFGLGGLFAMLGNYLPRLRSNWWMGIRTPWTLDSDEVWRRTHRLGGRLFLIAGLLCLAIALLPIRVAPWLCMGAIAIGSLTPVAYSYVIWRREKREG